MAVTKIWAVKSNMEYTIKYAKNPDKTSYEYIEADDMDIKDISDVISYAARAEKTLFSEGSHASKELVTGINCDKDSAVKEFILIKKRYCKPDKILAHHGYQSFAPGEVTPAVAHQIGIELAEKLWGDRFQVVVTTHLDRGHIHNHFVVNSVSFVDGKKFYSNKASYYRMREESDNICNKYRLSVLDNPKYNGISRGAYRANEEGRYNISDIVREDVDRMIMQSISLNDFMYRMQDSGYKIDSSGKYLTVFPFGHSKGIRIDRRWGYGYSIKGIEGRIRENTIKSRIRSYNAGNFKPTKTISGYRGTYAKFLYLAGVLPKKRGYTNKQIHFLLREELVKFNLMKDEMKFLKENHVENEAELAMLKSKKELIYKGLSDERIKIRNKLRRATDDTRKALTASLERLNEEMKVLRKELFMCNDVGKRTVKLNGKMNYVKENEKVKERGETYGRS